MSFLYISFLYVFIIPFNFILLFYLNAACCYCNLYKFAAIAFAIVAFVANVIVLSLCVAASVACCIAAFVLANVV